MEQARRSTMADHVHRIAPMGLGISHSEVRITSERNTILYGKYFGRTKTKQSDSTEPLLLMPIVAPAKLPGASTATDTSTLLFGEPRGAPRPMPIFWRVPHVWQGKTG